MKLKLLEVLVCPKCGGGLEAQGVRPDQPGENLSRAGEILAHGGEISSATLVCVSCAATWPVTGGIPRMLIGQESRQIREGFAEEWALRYGGAFENPGVLYGQDVGLLVKWMLETCIGRPAAGAWLLDAGCGSGEKAIALARQNPQAQVVAVDLVDTLERIRAMAEGLENLHLVQGDLLNPPFRPGTFPQVVSWSVLHHTPDTRQAFESVSRLVAADGRFVVWIYPHPEEDAFMAWYCRVRDRHFRGRGPSLSPRLRLALSRLYVVGMAPLLLYIDYAIVRPKYRGVPYMNAQKRGLRDELESGVFLIYDALTPIFHHCHRRQEVLGWFSACGFTQAETDRLGHYWGRRSS